MKDCSIVKCIFVNRTYCWGFYNVQPGTAAHIVLKVKDAKARTADDSSTELMVQRPAPLAVPQFAQRRQANF